MAETYKKIDENTLEITTTHKQTIFKKDLEQEKQDRERDISHAQTEISDIDNKLNALK